MRYLKTVFLVLISAYGLGQNAKVDSLESRLKNTHDEGARMPLLSELGEALLRKDSEKAFEYGTELMSLARNAKDHKWTSTAYHLLGRLHLYLGRPEKAEEIYLEAVEYEYKRTKVSDKRLAWQLYNAGNHYNHTGRYRKALIYFQKSLDIEYELDNKENQTNSLGSIGAMYLQLNVLDSAQISLEKGMNLAVEINDSSSIQTCASNLVNLHMSRGKYDEALGVSETAELYAQNANDLAYTFGGRGSIYYYLGKIDSAIYNFKKTAEYFEEAGRELEQGQTILNIGVLFRDQGNLKRSADSYKTAEEIFIRLGNNELLTAVYLNMAGVWEEKNDLDSSYHYYEKGLELALVEQNLINMGTAYQNLGILDEREGNYEMAADKLEKALDIFHQTGDPRLVAEANYTLSGVYVNLKQWEQARRVLDSSLNVAIRIGHVDLQIKGYDRQIKILSLYEGREELYLYHSEQIKLLDSIQASKNFTAMEELNSQYSLEEKEDSIRLQNIELASERAINDKISIINEQRGTMLWIAYVGGGIFLIMAILLFISRRKVKAKNAENELLLGEIHHRVKNNLQVISSLLSLQEKNIQDETAKMAILEGKERVKSMGLIHKMLYQHDNYSGIEMTAYIDTLINGLMTSFGIKSSELELDTRFDEINLDVDSAVPIGLIINELVINALKYAYESTDNPKISVKLSQESEGLKLSVKDNGKGELEKIKESKSFGLKLVRLLVKQLNGSLTLTSENGISYDILIKDYKLIGK